MAWGLAASAANYTNPVLHLDFSDPDVCIGRDGRAYLTASSFGGLPGLPILVSDDLVNWTWTANALKEHPFKSYGSPEHGNAVWAPAIRYRADKDEYVIYWGDPDRGVYRTAAKDPSGPWSAPRLVVAGKGLIDPCPLYDDDGRIYLVNAYAASRAGFNSVLTVRELDADETTAISEPVAVYDGIPDGNFTSEGPKFYKKDGAYWLFFPAGGVELGWQVVARSDSPMGAYEAKTVLARGKTDINGPHQGAWVHRTLKDGTTDDWFIHFRDKGAYGRIVHLEPMAWRTGEWPTMGEKGEPVTTHAMPRSTAAKPIGRQLPWGGLALDESFDGPFLGNAWHFLGKNDELTAWKRPNGTYRFYTTRLKSHEAKSFVSSKQEPRLWDTPNLCVQKFPAERFSAVLKARVGAKEDKEEAGIIVQGRSSARFGLRSRTDGERYVFDVVLTIAENADEYKPELKPIVVATLPATVIPAGLRAARTADVYLKVTVTPVAAEGSDRADPPTPVCRFAWSTDGAAWQELSQTFNARNGKWIGATIGLYALHDPACKDRGWLDADDFRFLPR